MNSKNGETSTFEIETRETFDKILSAINSLRQDIVPRLEKLEAGQAEIRKEQAEIRKEQVEIRKEQVEIRKEQVEIRKEFAEFNKEQTKFNKFVDVQLEAVRQGLVQNYQEILQLQKDTAETRMSNATIKSMVSELNERVYQMSRTTERSFS